MPALFASRATGYSRAIGSDGYDGLRLIKLATARRTRCSSRLEHPAMTCIFLNVALFAILKATLLKLGAFFDDHECKARAWHQ